MPLQADPFLSAHLVRQVLVKRLSKLEQAKADGVAAAQNWPSDSQQIRKDLLWTRR